MKKVFRSFIVKKAHTGHDDCYNQPKSVELKEGDVLQACDYTSNERGHLFFTINGNKNHRVKPSSYKARHPYDEGVYDLNLLEEITN